MSADMPDDAYDIPTSAAFRTALSMAHEEAEQFGHTFIGTEHLFLGLLRCDRALAGILDAHGVTRERFLDTMRTIYAEPMPVSDEMQLTGRARTAIAECYKAAQAMGVGMVGTAHLMLGVLVEPTGVVAGVFAAYGVERQTVADDVVATLEG